jgi:hypothetical protein
VELFGLIRSPSGERLPTKERMTNAVIESAVTSGKPKKLLDEVRDVLRLQRYILHRVPQPMRGCKATVFDELRPGCESPEMSEQKIDKNDVRSAFMRSRIDETVS